MAALLRLLAAGVAAALVLGPAVGARPGAKAVTVTLTDTAIRLSAAKAPVGTVVFTVVNRGKRPHSFQIAAKKTPLLAAGRRATLTVAFPKAGSYAYRSTVPGDAARGLKGVFTVQAAASASPGLQAGRQVFLANGCGSCHVLAAAGAVGTLGPNLDRASLTRGLIILRVNEGKGAMPPFAGQLTAQQIADVADFILAARAGG
jgi:mono/diheme cytochrome c family protein